MPTRLLPPGYQEFDANGAIAAGAKLYTYSAGTSTPKTTYSDAALTVANANPVVADGSGRFGDIFAGVGSYRLVMTKSDDSTLWTADPVDGASSSGSSGSSSSGNLIANGDFNLNSLAASSVADAAASFDGWYSLSQTGNVTVAQQTNAENGQPTNIRITQAQVTSQRFGHIQWIASTDSRWLRGSDIASAGRVRVSVQTQVNFALVEWRGTADGPTVDIVNDWNNGTFTPGNFFIASSIAVIATGSVTPTANVWTDLPSITGTVSSSLNNLYWMVWTNSAQVQNVTLDVGLVRVGQGTTAPSFVRVNETTPTVVLGTAAAARGIFRGTRAVGTDRPGGAVTIQGGQGTGTGAGGAVTIQTAPAGSTGSANNALVTAVQVDSAGAIQTGNASAATGYTAAGSVTGPAASVARFKNTAKAWINFNGVAGVAVRDSFNLTAARVSTGSYTCTFTNAMTDTNYEVHITAGNGPCFTMLHSDTAGAEVAPTTTTFRFTLNNAANSAQIDMKYISVTVFAL